MKIKKFALNDDLDIFIEEKISCLCKLPQKSFINI